MLLHVEFFVVKTVNTAHINLKLTHGRLDEYKESEVVAERLVA